MLLRTGFALLAFSLSAIAFADAITAPVKHYQLKDLQLVVSNSDACAPLLDALKAATQNSIALQFSPHPVNSGHFLVQDQNQQLTGHEYSVVKQEKLDGTLHRLGTGMLTLRQYTLKYDIDIAADPAQANFQYLYPIIISGENAHCYYTALLQPSTETSAAFKHHVQSGHADQKVDLTISE
ncbi:MAG: hypothetical protein EBX40_06805 [Gammaproteobacteria bacterium]|nr:hypothetical protein [Gammaproteobacteria bacterium]